MANEFNYKLAQEINPSNGTHLTASQFIEDGISQHISNTNETASPFLPEIEMVVDKLKIAYEEYYKSLGIKTIHWPKHIIRGKVNVAFAGIVEIKTRVKDGDSGYERELKIYNEAEGVLHELYHAIAPVKLHLKPSNSDDSQLPFILKSQRVGLAYSKESQLVEEGLATLSMIRFRKVLDINLPNGKYIRDQYLSQLEIPNDLPTELITIEIHDGVVEAGVLGHLEAYKLVEFLVKNIPKFEVLAENARINDQTLALAKAIESVFGSGTYRQIMQTKNSDALALINDLSLKLNSS